MLRIRLYLIRPQLSLGVSWRRFTAGYLALLVVGLAAAFAAHGIWKVPVRRAALAVGSLVFLAAAATAPNAYLFRVVRNVGWLSSVESDRTARRLLIGLSVLLLGLYACDELW